jgi:pimeloyl-ACP methyl ester carboxylesterase
LLTCVPGEYRAFAPDFRGCGSRDDHSTRQEWYLEGISIDDLAQDLIAFLDGIDLEHIVLLGHSLGGLVAMSFAMRYPERLLALVLEDTGPAEGISLGNLATPLLLPLEIKNRGMLRRGLRRAGIPKQGPLAEALLDDALSAPRGLYYQFSRAAAKWKAGDSLSQITVPTLLIWGENDQVMPKSYAEEYLRRIPDVRLCVIPGAGHSPHLEESLAFSDALYGFLNEHTSNGRKKPSTNDD